MFQVRSTYCSVMLTMGRLQQQEARLSQRLVTEQRSRATMSRGATGAAEPHSWEYLLSACRRTLGRPQQAIVLRSFTTRTRWRQGVVNI